MEPKSPKFMEVILGVVVSEVNPSEIPSGRKL